MRSVLHREIYSNTSILPQNFQILSNFVKFCQKFLRFFPNLTKSEKFCQNREKFGQKSQILASGNLFFRGGWLREHDSNTSIYPGKSRKMSKNRDFGLGKPIQTKGALSGNLFLQMGVHLADNFCKFRKFRKFRNFNKNDRMFDFRRCSFF